MLERLKLCIDRAIGEGTLVAVFLYPDGERQTPFRVTGSLKPESDMAKCAVRCFKTQFPHLQPTAVKLVKLIGTWQEAEQWTGNWHQITWQELTEQV